MALLKLKAIITEDRQLKLALPDNIPAGEIEIFLEIPTTWNESELAALQQELDEITPQSGADIVAWLATLPEGTGWEGVDDGGEWVSEQRRQVQQRHIW